MIAPTNRHGFSGNQIKTICVETFMDAPSILQLCPCSGSYRPSAEGRPGWRSMDQVEIRGPGDPWTRRSVDQASRMEIRGPGGSFSTSSLLSSTCDSIMLDCLHLAPIVRLYWLHERGALWFFPLGQVLGSPDGLTHTHNSVHTR